MEIEVTVPEGVTTADIYLNAEAGDGDVIIDDFRIWEHPGNTNRDGYVFYEDFENVDEGITPFFLAPGRGTSNRSHLAEKDLLGRQKMTWVLDGRFSLKTNQQAGETGQMLVTDDSTFKLEPNKTYELGFLYSLKDATPGYTVNIKSRSEGTLVSIPLEATGVEEGEYTKTNSKSQTFTTGNNDDYYISIDKGNGYADLILDNIYVTEIDESVESPVIDKVTLGSSITEIAVNESIDLSLLSIKALMNNGAPANIGDGKIEYVIGDNEVAKIEDGKLVGLKDGSTTLAVKVTLDNNVITSNTINIKVGVGSDNGGGEVTVDKSALQEVINGTKELVEDNYTTETWAEYIKALNLANEVMANKDATQKEVDTAKDALVKAIDELKFKEETDNKVNKEGLQALVNSNSNLVESHYTASTWKKFKKALDEAKEILAKEDATQEEVDKAKNELEKAIKNLKKITNESKPNNGGNAGGNGNSNGNGKLPQTGGVPAGAVGLFGTIIATIGSVMFKKKK